MIADGLARHLSVLLPNTGYKRGVYIINGHRISSLMKQKNGLKNVQPQQVGNLIDAIVLANPEMAHIMPICQGFLTVLRSSIL